MIPIIAKKSITITSWSAILENDSNKALIAIYRFSFLLIILNGLNILAKRKTFKKET